MKNSFFKHSLVSASVVFALANSGISKAHDQIGTLLDEASATDVYQISCSTDSGGASDMLEIQLIDPTTAAGGGKVSAVLQKDFSVITTSDKVRADADFSPLVSISAGNTAYTVIVHKLKTGFKNYQLEYHCKKTTGEHTGTSLITLQNQ